MVDGLGLEGSCRLTRQEVGNYGVVNMDRSDLVTALKECRQSALIDTAIDQLEGYIQAIGALDGQGGEARARSLMMVLSYAEDPQGVRRRLDGIIDSVWLDLVSGSWQFGRHNRRMLDACLYLMLELSSQDEFVSWCRVRNDLWATVAREGVQLDLFMGGMRGSFLKGLAGVRASPQLYSAVAYSELNLAMEVRLINDVLHRDKEGSNVRNCLVHLAMRADAGIAQSIIRVAHDLRRSAAPPIQGGGRSRREADGTMPTLLSVMRRHPRLGRATLILLHYAEELELSDLELLQKEAQDYGLSRDELQCIFSILGYEHSYINRTNIKLIMSQVPYVLLPTSRASSLEEYFEITLASWERKIDRRVEGSVASGVGLVSVLLCTKNPDLNLLECSIRSMVLQTYRPLELLIIDDGSDATTAAAIREVCERWQRESDLIIRNLRNAKSVGQYGCRNIGIQEACGQYIAIQDDDDISNPKRIECQVEALSRDDAARAAHVKHIRIHEAAGIMMDGDDLMSIEGDAPASFMWDRTVFRDVGPFLETKSRGDIEFKRRMIRKLDTRSIISIDHPLLLMRGAMNTVSAQTEYVHRGALDSFRYVMQHVNVGEGADSVDLRAWVPTRLRPS